jgi:uncharacterized membrane protein YdjX (TVP38/TMEM64 family)
MTGSSAKAAHEGDKHPAMRPATRISKGRVAAVVGIILLAALVAWSGALHRQVVELVAQSEPLFTRHPVTGALLFISLSALSAVLAFFSSALLVPVGVRVWGELGCFLLLWLGWFLGGLLTYAAGRGLGRPILRSMLTPRRLAECEARIPASHTFLPVLAAQLILPSEAVGYLCGLLRVPTRVYLPVLAVAELPYAAATVLLGAAFVHRQPVMLLAVALAGVGLLAWTHWHHRGTSSTSH